MKDLSDGYISIELEKGTKLLSKETVNSQILNDISQFLIASCGTTNGC